MARIIEPQTFTDQRQLLNDIIEKDTAEGAASVIKQYLTENNIVLANDLSDGNKAATHEVSRKVFSANSENNRQLRDLLFEPVFGTLKGGAQFLKKLYGKNFMKLQDWGVNVTTNGKLIYPVDVADQIALFLVFYAKHQSFPVGSSPLLPYLTVNDINIGAANISALNAQEANTKFKADAKAAEDETQLRNNFWLPVVGHTNGIGQFLIKLYPNNSKALGLWGYVVDDSPQKPKEITSKIKLAETLTINGVIIGGTLTNLGPVELHVYRGKTTLGTPAIVKANEQLGMPKGFSVITVVNPSTLQGGSFKVLRSK